MKNWTETISMNPVDSVFLIRSVIISSCKKSCLLSTIHHLHNDITGFKWKSMQRFITHHAELSTFMFLYCGITPTHLLTSHSSSDSFSGGFPQKAASSNMRKPVGLIWDPRWLFLTWTLFLISLFNFLRMSFKNSMWSLVSLCMNGIYSRS